MKTYRIKLETEAKNEINEIKDWYNLRKSGLGNKFRRIVKDQIENLRINPIIYQIKYKDIRCLGIKKFPYLVHYRVDFKTQTIHIISIFHTGRNPNLWLDSELE